MTVNDVTDLSKHFGMQFSRVRDMVLRSAEIMPEANFDFRPTPEMRTFAGSLMHVADANFDICEPLLGKPPASRPPKGAALPSTKAEVIGVLRESFDYCDRYIRAATLSSMMAGAFTTPPTGGVVARIGHAGTVSSVISHSNEMYGYISVYLRLKGITPPSSAPPKPVK